MRDRAPCGACGALVPTDRGCTHWRPRIAANASPEPRAVAARKLQERARQDAIERVAEFRRLMRLGIT